MKEAPIPDQKPMSEDDGHINVEVDTNAQVVIEDVINAEAQRSAQVEIGDTSIHRWVKEETNALLKITRELNEPSKKALLKNSMWKVVSREMEKLGYKRSSKKCREKFENVNKYNKRIKKGQVKRQCDRPYRFADQLEALHHKVKPPPVTKNGDNQDSIAVDVPTPMPASSIEGYEGSTPKKRESEFYEKLLKKMRKEQKIMHESFIKRLQDFERECLAKEEAMWKDGVDRIKCVEEMWAHERAIAEKKDEEILERIKNCTQQIHKLAEVTENENQQSNGKCVQL